MLDLTGHDRRAASDLDDASLTRALDEWQALLGAAHVIREAGALAAASTATFPTPGRVRAILRPANREQVQAAVRIANGTGVPVYPVSSGKNWGYGSRAPIAHGVLLDLARLDRIVDFDEELAYVTVEPGVTQGQLYEFLRARGSRLWMDATGASPDCSIIGNTLERGFGHTPMADHCGNVCAFEVVLPTGECIETGFGRFAAARAGALGRWGVGPSLDGLFSQSNLGIVTRMSVWLMPQPDDFQAFFFLCRDEDGLGSLIDALRPLRLDGTLRGTMHIGNDYKVLAASSQFPWTSTEGQTPLGRAHMEEQRRRLGIGAWNGSGALYGTRAQVRDARGRLRRALRGRTDRLQFVDDRLLRIMSRFATPFRLVTGWDVRRTLSVIAPVYGLMKGVPTGSTLASTYWRKRTPIPSAMDPDRDACGLLWCSPVFPATGSHAREVTRLAREIVLAHGFEPQMSVSLATERSAICVVTISYDRNADGQDERAFTCYRALIDALLSHGYPPYRLNVSAMEYLKAEGEYADVLARIKAALDPNRIVAPGRYEPS